MDAEQQRKEVSDRALLALKRMLDQLELSHGCLGELADLIQGDLTPSRISLGQGDRKPFERSQRSFNDLEAAFELAKRLSVFLGEQVEAAKDQMKFRSPRDGISSLPDDVLSYILTCATSGDRLGSRPVRAIFNAVSLSHVCPKFRSLILDIPRIWNFLSDQFVNVDMALHCIKYSKTMPLDVYIEDLARTRIESDFEDMVSAFLTVSARWKSLAIGQFYPIDDNNNDDGERDSRNLQSLSNNASAFSRLTNGHKFPSLTSLRIDYDHIPFGINLRNEKFNPHHHWSLPSLEHFDFSGDIPVPFKNAVKQTSIYYRNRDKRNTLILQPLQLQLFLASCRSLQSASLHLSGWHIALPCNPTKFPGVERVDLRFSHCSELVIGTTRQALDFHDAKEMAWRVPDWDMRYASDHGELVEEHLIRHPCVGLKSLHLEWTPRYKQRNYQAPYSPPFTKLPNLEHLKLSSSHWPWIQLLDVPYGVQIPALRTLTIAVNFEDWQHVSKWVVAVMARLKEQGDLNKFEALRIQEFAEHERKPSDLEGDIHDYLPDDKIIIELMDDN